MGTETASVQSRLRPQSSDASSFHSATRVHRSSTPAHWAQLRPDSYVAVDPYAASISHSIQNLQSREDIHSSLEDIDVPEHYSTRQHSVLTVSVANDGLNGTSDHTVLTYIKAFVLDTIPRIIYSFFLLRLPSLYFSRVARLFEDADLTMPEIKRMALELANSQRGTHSDRVHQVLFSSLSRKAPATSPFWDLKTNWESFIESLLREWKTLNIISVLLLSAILTVLQINSAANDPLTRYSALLSLICALMSLLYGCIFIIRFGGMKKPHQAAEWAWEARRTRTMIWWNVWVMLAMPSIWLSWSVIAYIICVMSLVWRTGSTRDGSISPLEPRLAFWPRLVISIFLSLGILYFVLITSTLRQYGSKMDRKWRERVKEWIDRQIYEEPFPDHMNIYPHVRQMQMLAQPSALRKDSYDSYREVFVPSARYSSRSPSPIHRLRDRREHNGKEPSRAEMKDGKHELLPPVKTSKALELRFLNTHGSQMPSDVAARKMPEETWKEFISEILDLWNAPNLSTPQATVLRALSRWNDRTFTPLLLEAVLCQEYFPDWPESPLYAIYILDLQPAISRQLPLDQRFGAIPPELVRMDVLDFTGQQHHWVTLFPERGTEVHFNFPSQLSPASPQQHLLRSVQLPDRNDSNDVESHEHGEFDDHIEGDTRTSPNDVDSGHEFPAIAIIDSRPATPFPESRGSESRIFQVEE